MLTKAFTGQIQEVKAENGQGLVVAAFAQLNAVDKDRDLVMAGCFGEQKARVQGAHDWNAPSLGVAKISERGDWAIAEIQYNLDIPAAKDRYESIKFSNANGLNTEYSFGYDVLEESPEAAREAGAARALRKLLVREVSDVVVGAGLDTHTVLVKSLQALPIDTHFSHAHEVIDAAIERAEKLAAEYKEGRVLSSANRNRLSSLHEALSAAMGSIAKILEDTDPEKEKAAEAAADAELKATEDLAAERINDSLVQFLLRRLAPIQRRNTSCSAN